jgi:hypothetical protein
VAAEDKISAQSRELPVELESKQSTRFFRRRAPRQPSSEDAIPSCKRNMCPALLIIEQTQREVIPWRHFEEAKKDMKHLEREAER